MLGRVLASRLKFEAPRGVPEDISGFGPKAGGLGIRALRDLAAGFDVILTIESVESNVVGSMLRPKVAEEGFHD